MKRTFLPLALLCLALAPHAPAAAQDEDERVVIETISGWQPCCGYWDSFDSYRDVRMDLACEGGAFEVRLYQTSLGDRIEFPNGWMIRPNVDVVGQAVCVDGVASVAVKDLHEGRHYVWYYTGLGPSENVTMVMTGVRA